jgi:hypothetical protein
MKSDGEPVNNVPEPLKLTILKTFRRMRVLRCIMHEKRRVPMCNKESCDD